MRISDVSVASGLPAKTIRYYKDIDLVRPARGANGYRDCPLVDDLAADKAASA